MKAFVIRLKDDEDSETFADICINSAKKCNLTVDKFNGIYGQANIDQAIKDFNVRPFSAKIKKNRLGVKGCFLSHYSLWLKSYELNESIIIFEHDAVMLRPLPIDIESMFDEFLLLDPYNKFTSGYGELHQASTNASYSILEYQSPDSRKKYGILHEYALGLQAYMIKPKAALKLIRSIQQTGFYPADMQCHKGILHLETIYPSIASVNEVFYNNFSLMNALSSTKRSWT